MESLRPFFIKYSKFKYATRDQNVQKVSMATVDYKESTGAGFLLYKIYAQVTCLPVKQAKNDYFNASFILFYTKSHICV